MGRAARLTLSVPVAVMVVGSADGQTYYERNAAASKCYRDVQRRLGPPPRDNARPGDDLVQMERRRRDYDDRYRDFLDRCLYEADRQLRQKKQ